MPDERGWTVGGHDRLRGVSHVFGRAGSLSDRDRRAVRAQRRAKGRKRRLWFCQPKKRLIAVHRRCTADGLQDPFFSHELQQSTFASHSIRDRLLNCTVTSLWVTYVLLYTRIAQDTCGTTSVALNTYFYRVITVRYICIKSTAARSAQRGIDGYE